MPFHRPISEDKQADSGRGGGMVPSGRGLAQAEGVMQIAFVLPCAMVVGWAGGWLVDKLLHWHWATLVGLVLGIVSGMLTAIRMAMAAMNPKRGGK